MVVESPKSFTILVLLPILYSTPPLEKYLYSIYIFVNEIFSQKIFTIIFFDLNRLAKHSKSYMYIYELQILPLKFHHKALNNKSIKILKKVKNKFNRLHIDIPFLHLLWISERKMVPN